MTVKEIAEAVGKKERVVHDWTLKTSAKYAQVRAKIAEAIYRKIRQTYRIFEATYRKLGATCN